MNGAPQRHLMREHAPRRNRFRGWGVETPEVNCAGTARLFVRDHLPAQTSEVALGFRIDPEFALTQMLKGCSCPYHDGPIASFSQHPAEGVSDSTLVGKY